ncbi:hypothetical protein VHEMI04146 [[Torrubiella] hemipterigena]|nr:hypothetical protein VHEMI04146 [[Torrubiella] hemipterigena]
MDQLIHPQTFLSRYQVWWSATSLRCTEDVEFAVLFLRMASYASQFLPSPLYTLERIRGMPLSEIRTTCGQLGDELAAICSALDSKGSLVRVQHLLFAGLQTRCEGRIDAFWDLLNAAIRVAQRLGMHRAATDSSIRDELQTEIRRRTFCNLYIWDSLLARQLDRIPFLPENVSEESLPQLRLSPELVEPDAPECFTERLLQVRLATFWRTSNPGGSTNYNAPVAEERYEEFCRQFIPMLHPAFALNANTKWDAAMPSVPLQRQRLRITMLDSVCWNFRPVLRLKCSFVAGLSAYKRVLISSQRRALVAASLKILEAVATLHSLLGASHTRFVDVVFYTFEAAVLVLFLCTEPGYLQHHEPSPTKSASEDPLGLDAMEISIDRCLQAAREALDRLRMLAEVSDMAAAGSRALAQLLDRWPEGLTMADFETDGGAYQDLPMFGKQMQGFSGDYSTDPLAVAAVSAVPVEDISPEWYGTGEFDFTFDVE